MTTHMYKGASWTDCCRELLGNLGRDERLTEDSTRVDCSGTDRGLTEDRFRETSYIEPEELPMTERVVEVMHRETREAYRSNRQRLDRLARDIDHLIYALRDLGNRQVTAANIAEQLEIILTRTEGTQA